MCGLHLHHGTRPEYIEAACVLFRVLIIALDWVVPCKSVYERIQKQVTERKLDVVYFNVAHLKLDFVESCK